MEDNGDLRRSDPDPALGGLDEDIWRARQRAADVSLPMPRRREAAMEARGLRRAVLVLTGKVVALVGLLRVDRTAPAAAMVAASAAVGVALAVVSVPDRQERPSEPPASTATDPAPTTRLSGGPTSSAPPVAGQPSPPSTPPGSAAPSTSSPTPRRPRLPLPRVPLPSVPIPVPSLPTVSLPPVVPTVLPSVPLPPPTRLPTLSPLPGTR